MCFENVVFMIYSDEWEMELCYFFGKLLNGVILELGFVKVYLEWIY